MRMTKRDEVIAIYDRTIRLIASVEVTLDSTQRAELVQMLNEEAARYPEEPESLGLRLFVQLIRAYD